MPFALRRLGDEVDLFQLIGETYIHGIMNGEVLEAVVRKEAVIEEIRLR
jgi:hypothetical protein